MRIAGGITGALSMVFVCTLRAPRDGLFVLLIPGAVGNVATCLLAIAAGTVVGAALVAAVERPPAEMTSS